MKIVLSGGTGFIGSHFLKQALTDGHTVRALRRSSSSRSRLPIRQQPEWLDRQLDEVIADDLYGYDVLVHLSAHTGNFPYDTLHNCFHWNVMAVLQLFEKARCAGIKRYIVAGSCFEYGRSGERYAEIPADALLDPTNSYAASKAAATIALKQWAVEHKLSLEILRIFHVFGDGEHATRLWPSLRQAAVEGKNFPMTKGEQIRDFQPVDRVVRAFLRRATLLYPSSETVIMNLGTGNPCSIAEFAVNCWSEWNATGSLLLGYHSYRPDEVMRYVPKTDIYI